MVEWCPRSGGPSIPLRATLRVHRQEYPEPVVEECGSNYSAPAIRRNELRIQVANA